jgi:diguanylate cyclase (GGDEF)-like protein
MKIFIHDNPKEPIKSYNIMLEIGLSYTTFQISRLKNDKIMTSPFRFNIANKMFLALLPLSLLIILISAFALSALNELNEINSSIVKTNIPIAEDTDKMIDSLLAQEHYGRQYAILKTPDMLELFKGRSEEFDQLVAKIQSLPDRKEIPLDQLTALHQEYNSLFLDGFNHLRRPSSSAAKRHDEQIRQKQEELITLIKKISEQSVRDRNEKRVLITKIGEKALHTTAVLCIAGIIIGIGTAVLITRNITGHINQLSIATERISEGKFDQIPRIQNQDEFGELSRAFGEMAKRLKKLEEMYLDASPLTKLPGSLAAENVIKKRLESGLPTAFCFPDIDNFKSFNDKYGYARGNEVIQTTAKIIERAVSEHGTGEDFIGHIGGDDFLIITAAERYKKICSSVVEQFNESIPELYDREDRERGYIEGITRQGQEISFPLITISIAVVTNERREITNHLQVGEIAAELKKYVKSLPGSVYVADRRRS